MVTGPGSVYPLKHKGQRLMQPNFSNLLVPNIHPKITIAKIVFVA